MDKKPSPWAYLIAIVIVVATLSAGWLYVSGFTFLLLAKMPTSDVGLGTWLSYWTHYGELKPVRKQLVMAGAVGLFLCFLVPAFAWLMATGKKRELHGSARFANDSEIRKSGLLSDTGIMVGKYKGKFLMFPGQQFVLLAAPTRAGKGVGIVIPNLLTYPDSVVVLDVKQENYDITAGFRAKHGHEVFLFNPFAEDMRTHRYNPLGYISDDLRFRIGDILALAQAFWSGEGKNADPVWDDLSRDLFLGLCLYLCETPELPRTIGEMLRQSSGKGMPAKEYLQGLVASRNFVEVDGVQVPRTWTEGDPGLPPLSPECVDALIRFTSTPDNMLGSIKGSFNAPLVIWNNPIVDAATSANDFDLREVRKKRMTIYIGITPDHLAEAGLLVNVLFSQLVNLNTKELPQRNPALKHQCLLLMDEFTAIGKVKIIAKAVSYMAGYNLRLLPIIQSVSQLASVYGPEDSRTFITNHALQVYFAPREQKDANEYSEMLGYETVKSISKGQQIGGKGGRSKNESDQRRALLLPQELKELGVDREILSLENTKPILCEKIRYYQDKRLMQRLLPAPAVPTLDIDRHIAQIHNRVRELTPADVAGGVDLGKLTADLCGVETLDSDFVAGPEEVKRAVDSLFGALGVDLSDLDSSAAGPGADAAVAGAEAYEAAAMFAPDAAELDGMAAPFLEGSVEENDALLDDMEGTDWGQEDSGDSDYPADGMGELEDSAHAGLDLSLLDALDERVDPAFKASGVEPTQWPQVDLSLLDVEQGGSSE